MRYRYSHFSPLDLIRRNERWFRLGFLVFLMLLWGAGFALADDCRRDFTRLEDCLRTGGWAPAIAGTTTTIVTILVNGTEIVRTVKKKKGEDEDVRWTFDIRTQDNRTKLVADGEEELWIYARVLCNKPEKRPDLVTRGIAFAIEGTHADWVDMGRPQMREGLKAVRLQAEPPTDDAELTDEDFSVIVTATIEGDPMSAPVKLKLEALEMTVEVIS